MSTTMQRPINKARTRMTITLETNSLIKHKLFAGHQGTDAQDGGGEAVPASTDVDDGRFAGAVGRFGDPTSCR